MTAEVVTLYESNFRDPVATLRRIAEEIEAGRYGDVGTLTVALLGDTFEVFGAGEHSDGTSVCTLLQAGVTRIVNSIEGHGK